MDDRYQRLFMHNGSNARYLVAYLQRGESPSHIQASIDLATGVCNDVAVGSLGWNSMIPVMY
jgi:hypothetical protein